MSHLFSNYAVVAGRSRREISIIDTDELWTLHRLDIGLDVIDAAITVNNDKALVTSKEGGQFIEIDLSVEPPVVKNTVPAYTQLTDVDITPDCKFAVSVNGDAPLPNVVSLNLTDYSIKKLYSQADAISISPNGNGHMLAAHHDTGRVGLYLIDGSGNITNTGMESQVNNSPVNISYSPDGNFAFVANYSGNEIVVLDTSNPNYYGEASRITTGTAPHTIAVSEAGHTVYVLTDDSVKVYEFDTVAKRLTLVNSFGHNLSIAYYPGIDQMALDATGTKLFICGMEKLSAFNISGVFLRNVSGIKNPDGGIAASKGGRKLPDGTVLLASYGYIELFNPVTLNKKRVDINHISFNIAVSGDRSKAAVTAYDNNLRIIDLASFAPVLKETIPTPVQIKSLAVTTDNRFVVGISGGNNGQILSYSFLTQSIKSIPSNFEAVAISPNGNGHILATRRDSGRVRLYTIDGNGDITDTGMESLINGSPLNIAFSPDGSFAFVACSTAQQVVVMDTANPYYFGEASRISINGSPQTILVSKNGTKLYVLTNQEIAILNFDPVAKRLSLEKSFTPLPPVHINYIYMEPGLNQMALDITETKLFLWSYNSVTIKAAYAISTSGEYLGLVSSTVQHPSAIVVC
jgi:DNA-binding beta-propeller fold protein YncE